MQKRHIVDCVSAKRSHANNLLELQIAALEAMANAVVIADLTGAVIWINSAFERLTGYRHAEIVGQNTRVLKSGLHPRAFYEEMWRTILTGGIWRGELKNRRKDGSLYSEEMTITPVRDSRGEITHYIGIKQDISERKQVEAKLLILTERLSLATAVAKMGVWDLDLASNAFTWDATMFQIYGFPPALSVPYEKWSAAVHPEDLPVAEAELRKAIEEKGQGAVEIRIILADGTVRNISAVGRVLLDERANVSRVLGTAQDITGRKRSEEKFTMLARAVESASELVAMTDSEFRITFVNRALLHALRYSEENEILGRNVAAIMSPDNPPELFSEIATRTMESGVWRGECLHRRADGSDYPVLLNTNVVKDQSGRTLGILGIAQDITERIKTDQGLRLWSQVLDQSAEGIFICDPQERILLVNTAFEQLTGYSADEAVGKTPRILQSGRQDRAFYTDMWKNVLETGKWQGEIWNRRKSGEFYAEWLSITAVCDRKGFLTHYVGIFSDITARKQDQERMVHLAHHDALTDLPNRVLLMDRIDQLMRAAQRTKSKVAVLFIDLDRFKEVNDSLGHDAGDLLLQTVARRLSKAVRDEDTVARLGGDEFVVVFQGLHHARDVAVLAQKLLSCLVEPVILSGHELTVTASMGISLYPDDATNGQEILRNADAAMYQAKGAGRNAYQFYTSDLNRHALEMLSTENALRRAIERQEFVLHYQPCIDINSGSVAGAEALIRWNHPDFGLLMPGKFIPIAEERGLIVPIGDWVIEEASRQAGVWQNSGRLSIPIAVNVSAVQFRQKDFVEQLAKSVRRHGITPNRIELELTETAIMRDAEITVAILERLHNIGFQLSIDDFGTGYSSMNYLRRFPVDKIKIDQSFVRDKSAVSIVTAIIGLAQSLKLKVIAEGVQTNEQLELLRELRCDEAQGFLFSPALVSGEFEKLVCQWKPKFLGSPESWVEPSR